MTPEYQPQIQPRYSFVIPLFNEEEVFGELVQRLDQLVDKIGEPCEVVLVDDGSSDSTPSLMEQAALNDPKYHCVFLSRNYGHQVAISAGLEYATAEAAVMILDGDLQDPPEMFFEFRQALEQGYDVAYGIRKKRKEGGLKRLLYFLFYRLLSRISNSPINLDSGDFSMLSRRLVDILVRMPEQSRFVRGMRSWAGFGQIGVEYEREARAAGAPKYTFKKLWNLAYEGIFNFSVFPIKLMSILGLFCVSISVIYFAQTLIKKFWLGGDVPIGFTALLFMIVLFGGVQLLFLGIIGEYVYRIFFQVKNRPIFLVRKRVFNGQLIDHPAPEKQIRSRSIPELPD